MRVPHLSILLLAATLGLAACGDGGSAQIGAAVRQQAATASPTPTATPPASAGVRIVLSNDATNGRQAIVGGVRLSGPADGRATSYGPIKKSLESKTVATLGVGGLAPGVWLHRVDVPATGQRQYRQALVVDDPAAPSVQAWTLYGSVLTVNNAADGGDGKCDASCSLREAVNAATRKTAPALVVFDHEVLGDAAHVEVKDQRILIDTPGLTIDGTDAQGNPSPLVDFAARTFPVRITLRGTKQAPPDAQGPCPCRQNYGGTLFAAAAKVQFIGLHIDRVYPPEKLICCGNQTLIEMGRGGRSARVDTCLLDGGGRAIEDAQTPKGNTGQATSKDCIKPEHSGSPANDPAVITNSELAYCLDRGLKVQDDNVVLSHSWVHNQLRCALFAIVPGGSITAHDNLIEEAGLNCPSGAPPFCENQVVTRVEAPQVSAQGNGTSFDLDGNVVRTGPLNGVFWQVGSTGSLRNSFVCGMGDAGILSIRQAGKPTGAVVRGSASVLNTRSGVDVRKQVGIDLGRDGGADAGLNAFAGNPAGAQAYNSLDVKSVIQAQGNQWASCYDGAANGDVCNLNAISAGDTNNSMGLDEIDVSNPLPHQAADGVTLSTATPSRVVEGALVSLRGSGFDAISGIEGLTSNDCAKLATTNTCTPLHGTCVEFLVDGTWTEATDVLAVTPTFLMVRSPFTCSAPTQVRVRRNVRDGGEAVSEPLTICTN
jgi:CSLREA domain-containing protein